MSLTLTGISSMATRQILAELAARYEAETGTRVAIESVGGVDAAKRVRAGEAFDLVLLAQDALDKLAADQCLVPDTLTPFVRSALAVACPEALTPPALTDASATRAAIVNARAVGYSTGPSGTYLVNLIKSWGIEAELGDRLKQSPAGVPVAAMVARGEVDLGFQQLSELIGTPGITILPPLPADIAYVTVFAGAVGANSTNAEAARAFLRFLVSPDTAAVKTRHGMDPA